MTHKTVICVQSLVFRILYERLQQGADPLHSAEAEPLPLQSDPLPLQAEPLPPLSPAWQWSKEWFFGKPSKEKKKGVTEGVSCVDEAGQAVDWWILYKLPQ